MATALAAEENLQYVGPGVVEEFVANDDSGSINAEEDLVASHLEPGLTVGLGGDDGADAGGIKEGPMSHRPDYCPISREKAEKVQMGDEGLIWHAQIVADNFNDPKHTLPSGELKPRRPLPQARVGDFFRALVQTSDGRLIFGGVLNGWPALTNLELRSITYISRDKLVRLRRVRRHYDAATGEGSVPRTTDEILAFASTVLAKCSVRVTLRAPKWTGRGYSEESPGHVFWFDAVSPTAPRILHGTAIAAAFDHDAKTAGGKAPQMTKCHLFGHRYAKVRESAKDRLTYHSAVLVEWDHGHHCSVVELAWLNGIGGYGGRSNFVLDRDSPRPALYHALPACMKAPWIQKRAEVRIIDHPAKNKQEFDAFLHENAGPSKRFVGPQIVHSAGVKLTHRSATDLAYYLINYSFRNARYVEESRNCQTFAADLFRHLSGNFSVEPFHPVCRPFYVSRTNDFLYAFDPPQAAVPRSR